ncbi:MAG: hypothetical protein ABR559_07750 [Gemmatimonadota bacterium]
MENVWVANQAPLTPEQQRAAQQRDAGALLDLFKLFCGCAVAVMPLIAWANYGTNAGWAVFGLILLIIGLVRAIRRPAHR